MLKPIETDEQYNNALARIYELMQTDTTEGSVSSDELELLSIVIKEYELIHHPIAATPNVDHKPSQEVDDTAYLSSSPTNAEHLNQSIAQGQKARH